MTAIDHLLVGLDDAGDIPLKAVPPENTWTPANLLELAANPPAPPTIGGLLYPAKRTVLSGETESMKTWLALILCKAEIEIGNPVGWVDLDAMGPGALLERLQLLGLTDEQIGHDFLYFQPSEMLDPAKITTVTDTIAERTIRLFVIDAFNPILSLHGLDPSSTPDIETFWRTIADPIANAGAAPVLLDHVVKNSENRGKYSYGSERKASGAIVHIGFRLLEALTKGGRGKTLLTVHKDRPGYLPRPTLGRLVLTSENDQIGYRVEADHSHDGDTFRPTVLMEKISRELERQTDPVSQTWVEENVQGNREGKRAALKVLAEDGYIAQQTGPRNALLFTTIRPYVEAEEQLTTTAPSPRPDRALDLRSSPAVDPAHTPPHKGRGAGSTEDLGDERAPTPPNGHPIYEYERPPIDESLAPELEITW